MSELSVAERPREGAFPPRAETPSRGVSRPPLPPRASSPVRDRRSVRGQETVRTELDFNLLSPFFNNP